MNHESRMIRGGFLFWVSAFFALIIATGTLAANQIKTTETYITSSEGTVTNPTGTTTTVTLYIGDNLSGVTTPVKSAHIAISGMYTTTGASTLDVQLDTNASRQFTLANVGATATPFEILYNATGQISPASSGTYTYTLVMTPSSGVTIYGLAAKLAETHEYVPASCADGQSANEKVKTTETYITSSEGTVTNPTGTTTTVTLYIGDNLSGVTTPVKSAHIAISGVYTTTGASTLDVQLDANASQQFTLANVSTTPTPFEILYNATGQISPASSGTYTYTLVMTPSSGVIIYGLAAKLAETHRYKPPACGGFSPSGSVESSTFDTGISAGAAYNSLLWNGALGDGNVGRVKLQIATSNSSSGPWTYYGSDCGIGTFYEPTAGTSMETGCPSVHNNKRYFRYKITVCSANDCTAAGTTTPTVTGVIINWSP